MKAWGLAVGLAILASAAGAAENEKARPREGGSGSSAVGARHHSDPGSGARTTGGSGAVSAPSPAHSTPTAAQLRHPRAGTGSGFRDRGFRGRNYWYDPYWYGGRGWYGWSGWYGGPYGWYSPYYYSGFYGYSPYQHRYGYSAYRGGSVRVLVDPNEARVYVDGYYAGIADDFDGIFQRLHLAPGRHDITLKLEGYRTHRVKLFVPYDHTIKLHHKMVRGTGEDVSEDVVGRPEDYARYDERDEDLDEMDARDRRSDQDLDRALVRLDVEPPDASVYVDGAFRGTGRELRRLRLVPGRHRIEVVRPGYRTVEREVEVRPGQTLDLEIDLQR